MKDYHQTGMYNGIESLLLAYRAMNNIVYVKLSGTDTKSDHKLYRNQMERDFPDQPFAILFSRRDLTGSLKPTKKEG